MTDGGPGRLESKLRAGIFAVTAELSPPRSADPATVRERARPLAGVVDAVNVTDNTAATVAMSALAAAVMVMEEGSEPVVQITSRDRNRMAIQSDLLGMAALGVRNVLLLSGDPPSVGDHPDAKAVFDLDTIELIRLARDMRDRGVFMSGEEIRGQRPRLFLGAAANPFLEQDRELERLRQKIEAGADFIQTQMTFDPEALRRFLAAAIGAGLLDNVRVLAGVGAPRSAATARRWREEIPGIVIPDPIVARLEESEDPAWTGVEICCEIIEQVRDIPGVSGVHVMATSAERVVQEIVRRSHLRAG